MQSTNYLAHYVFLSTFLLPLRPNLLMFNILTHQLKIPHEFGLCQRVSFSRASTFIL